MILAAVLPIVVFPTHVGVFPYSRGKKVFR